MSLRICWHSTCPWGSSSYSILTKRTVPGIVYDGHTVVVSTWYGLQGEPQLWPIKRGDEVRKIPVLPGGAPEAYGVDTVLANYIHHESNLLIACMDAWSKPVTSVTTPRGFPPVPPRVKTLRM